VITGDLAEYSERHAGSFDAVCAFHVVEHLTDVVPFLRHMSRCLRPGGQVFLSVPNRARYYRKPVEPLDCPPHHLSRWAPAQMRRLGNLIGLRMVEISTQPVDVNMIREEIPAGIRRRLETIPVAGGFLGRWSTRILARTLFRESLGAWYDRSGIFDRMGFQGMNVAARYAKAGSRTGGERGD
jgi:SAM-dependent methyltransferase